MRNAIAAMALGLLCWPATAPADLAPLVASPPYSSVAGPAFAGDGVAWGRMNGGLYELVTLHDPAGPELTTIAAAYHRGDDVAGHLEASDRRVVLGLALRSEAGILTGPVGGELLLLAGCVRGRGCAGPCRVDTEPDVSGDAVAFADCNGVHVEDLAPGASPSGRSYPGRELPRVAGPYVAATAGDYIVVSNWVSGDDVYSVPSDFARGDYDIQADGTLAFSHFQADSLSWASPAEPFEHEVARWAAPYEVRIAGDLIGAEFDDPPEDRYDYSPRGYSFDVVGLHPDPELVRNFTPSIFDHSALDGIDFDGARLMWTAHRCRHAWLQIWDPRTRAIEGDRPDSCPLPRIVPGSARIDRERHLSLTLECDVQPGPACVGEIRRLGRRGRPLTIVRYSVAEGRRKVVGFPRRGSLCRTGRHRALARVRVEREVRAVNARGPTRGLPSC
jgi:hypothetical protein